MMSSSWRAVVLAGAAAVVAGVGWAGTRLAQVDLSVGEGTRTSHVGLPAVLVVAFVAVLLSSALRLVLIRRLAHGERVWLWTALVVLGLSLVLGPPTARTLSAGLALASLHLEVGAVAIIGGMRRRACRTVT